MLSLRSWSQSLVILLTFLLVGCYPEYNWRELPLADGLVVAAFPAKVHTQTRNVTLADIEVEFVVESARVKDNIFALGYARLPEGLSIGQRQAIKQAMTESLFHSVGATPTEDALAGRTFVVNATQSQTKLLVVGRVLAHRNLIVRMMAAGPADQMQESIGREFTQSLSLR